MHIASVDHVQRHLAGVAYTVLVKKCVKAGYSLIDANVCFQLSFISKTDKIISLTFGSKTHLENYT